MKKIKIKSKKLKNVKRKCTNTRQDSSLECTNLAEPDETQVSELSIRISNNISIN